MELESFARLFKALSNEQRLKIFMMIREQSASGAAAAVLPSEMAACCAIEKAFTKVCACMDLSRSTVSHHFKELQGAGLITCERDGQMYRCRVNEATLASLREFLK